jgi:hypothetical protein
MKRLTLTDFYAGNFTDRGYSLYIVKDADGKVMYIGISAVSIWSRWFGGGTSHMGVGSHGEVYGKSTIGEVIERRFPDSWNWMIELWTVQDCRKFLDRELAGQNVSAMTIRELEPYMIEKLAPLYNVLHNGETHEDPLLTPKLDEAYRKIFG